MNVGILYTVLYLAFFPLSIFQIVYMSVHEEFLILFIAAAQYLFN